MAKKVKKFRHPLDLPEVPNQCAHVEEHWTSDGADHVRCLDDNLSPDIAAWEKAGIPVPWRHGYLCNKHYNQQRVHKAHTEALHKAYLAARGRQFMQVDCADIAKTEAEIISVLRLGGLTTVIRCPDGIRLEVVK